MKQSIYAMVLGTIILLYGTGLAVAEQMIDLGNSAIAAFGTDPVLVDAVKKENARARTLDEIKVLDQQWAVTQAENEFVKTVLENEIADYLKDIQKQQAYYAKIFLVDNQGALVAATNKISDYWQGDEAQFTHTVATGTIQVSDVEFDPGAQTYLLQISVPVKDEGAVIGAITFGIDLRAFQ
ncbi:PDC sensor domain-containing protein [Desulfosudis oleivorans]|uniref:Cache domain-containing protein n=1 Tax=Desulfosudis oleivorans (strain DSM 6200 / JCM 39069 / Hxd3) TaxID=96561 RepID=A9A0J1_DESOH|nr:PDC sensor domain-containing protein [Desulfosudis oleivorans]ABW67491.1 conserved hypothetical protein [Desulfosudis oleivorans Hxd3]